MILVISAAKTDSIQFFHITIIISHHINSHQLMIYFSIVIHI
jgi:hypothetical protein